MHVQDAEVPMPSMQGLQIINSDHRKDIRQLRSCPMTQVVTTRAKYLAFVAIFSISGT